MWTSQEKDAIWKRWCDDDHLDDIARAERLASFAVELVAARDGTMTAEAVAHAIAEVPRPEGSWEEQKRWRDRLARHITPQGTTVADLGSRLDALAQEEGRWEAELATLQAKVDGLKIEMAERSAALDESLRRESDLIAKVERLKAEVGLATRKANEKHDALLSAESRLAAIQNGLKDMAGDVATAEACLWCEAVPPALHKDRCKIELMLQDTHPDATDPVEAARVVGERQCCGLPMTWDGREWFCTYGHD